MELTKEHFDKAMAALAKELKAYAREQTEELAFQVADGFSNVQAQLNVQELVQAHEQKLRKLEEAPHIKS